MKVELKSTVKAIRLRNLLLGDCFRFQHAFWMRIEGEQDMPLDATCVGIGQSNVGEIRTIAFIIEVIPFEFKLVEI